MKVDTTLIISAALVTSLGCAGSGHARPTGVPEDAVWAGGIDGGNWIACDIVGPVNRCAVYHDYTGEIRLSGDFQLEGQSRAARRDELVFLYADVLLKSIHLEDGKLVLVDQ